MLNNRNEQIIQTHAQFICQAASFAGSSETRAQFNTLMKTADENGWNALAAALRLIAAGQRELALIKNLDEEDQVIAEAVMRGIQNPATLPDPNQKPDSTMAAPGLAGMIHAAATGNIQALTLVSQMAEQMGKAGGDMARISGAIRPLINGERDPEKLTKNMDARGQQLLLSILGELNKLT